jgi:phosphatidylserine/phosphatidylglycerophosphate/cardiolipin synthase-like enzyme
MTARSTQRRTRHSSWGSLFSAHRLKLSLASFVSLLGLAASAGYIDASKLPTWLQQMVPQVSTLIGFNVTPGVQAPSAPVAVAAGSTRTTCFTPGQDCTTLIVNTIDTAKTELRVQAYGFTASAIIDAIGRAKARGVDVQVILDKSNESAPDSGAPTLVLHGITPKIDDTVAIAHNKVMVIDQKTVITGSFNFTTAAQHSNAENVLIITGDPDLAATYRKNWESRAGASRPYLGFIPPVL